MLELRAQQVWDSQAHQNIDGRLGRNIRNHLNEGERIWARLLCTTSTLGRRTNPKRQNAARSHSQALVASLHDIAGCISEQRPY